MMQLNEPGPIKVGIIGAGAVADFGHCPAIASTSGLSLHAIYDPVFEKAVALQKKYGATHAFHDFELFLKCGVQAVTVCSPAPTHRDNVLACASNELAVLCEKPIAMTVEEGEEMVRAMDKAQLPFTVGFCYRYSGVAQTIKELVKNKIVGEVKSLRLIFIWNLHGIHEWTPNGEPFYSPQRAARMNEGGPLVDCGVHQIDLARWWLESEVKSWSAEGAWLEDYEAPDHVYLHLRHDNGALTTIEVSFSYCHTAKDPISHFTYQLIGTEGLIRYDRESGLFEVRSSNETLVLPWSHEKNFEGMYAAWERALRTGQSQDLPTPRDGIEAVELSRLATEDIIRRGKS